MLSWGYYGSSESRVRMKLAVLVRPLPDGTFQARVPLIPGLAVSAPRREQALSAIRCAVSETDPATEFVIIDVPIGPDGQPDPWLEMAGIFAGDPTIDDMLRETYAARDTE